MKILNDLSEAEQNVIQLIYPYTVSQEVLVMLKEVYGKLVGMHNASRAYDFGTLANLVHQYARVCIPKRPYIYRPASLDTRWLSRPLMGAGIQFTVLLPSETYLYVLGNGEMGRIDIDLVLSDFETGEFLLLHALQLPLVKLRIDPFTPVGKWY